VDVTGFTGDSEQGEIVATAKGILAVAAALVVLGVGCSTQSGGGSAYGAISVNPAAADPSTTSDPVFVNLAYGPQGTPNGKLAVVFHGSSANPQAHLEMASSLSSIGYHVIVLRYSASVGTQSACPDSVALTDPDCHRAFRSEVVFGAGVPDNDGQARNSPATVVSASDSVVNRLLKLVEYLTVHNPSGGWQTFQAVGGGASCALTDSRYGDVCDLDWTKVVLMGHSQGAGTALYLSKFYPVDHVGMTSGPYDAFLVGDGAFTPAAWIAEGGFEVPPSRMAGLTHLSDFGLGRIRAAQTALGMPGPEVVAVDPPFATRRLVTTEASTCPLDGVPNHNSTAVDICTPNGAYVAAWRFLAGA
jgi:pimeloyl-ACP methyl ester carboxylesterase